LLAFSIVAMCAAAAASPSGAVKIGIVNSMTGPEAPIGEQLTNGIKLAEADLAAKGIQVRLVWEDDGGRPATSMGAVEKLVTRDAVSGIVGPYTSSTAMADARVAERYKVPLVVPVAAKEEITRQGLKWTFRLGPPTGDLARTLLEMALAFGKPTSIGIVNENTDFGVSAAKSARKFAEEHGMKVVFQEAYSAGSPDYRSMLVRLKAARPELVYMVSYIADAILLMRQSRELTLSPMAFIGGGPGFALSQFAREETISNAVFTSTLWTPDAPWPGAREWALRYQARFGKPASHHAAAAYEATMILAHVAADSSGDREKIRAALREGRWEGIMGEVTFRDYDGYANQNKHQVLVEQVQNGRHWTIWPPEFATHAPIWPFPGWN